MRNKALIFIFDLLAGSCAIFTFILYKLQVWRRLSGNFYLDEHTLRLNPSTQRSESPCTPWKSGFHLTVERDWFWFCFWFYYALWLASVFTLVLVLRQSSENRSKQYHRKVLLSSCHLNRHTAYMTRSNVSLVVTDKVLLLLDNYFLPIQSCWIDENFKESYQFGNYVFSRRHRQSNPERLRQRRHLGHLW